MDEVSIIVPKESANHPLVQHLNGENLVFNEDIYQFQDADVKGDPTL